MLVEFQQQVSVDCNDWKALITALDTPDKDGHRWTGAFIPLSADDDYALKDSVQRLCEFIAHQAIFESCQWSFEANCFVKFIEGFGRFHSIGDSALTNNIYTNFTEGCTIVVQVGRFENDFDPSTDRKNEILKGE